MKTKEKPVDSYREVVGSYLYEYLKINFFKRRRNEISEEENHYFN